MLIILVFCVLVCSVAGHVESHRKGDAPYGWQKREVTPSTCSFLQCAVSHGNCGAVNSLIFCPTGEHCSNSNCVEDLPLDSTCDIYALENECASGRCVNTGNGARCQISQEIMPGNPCTSDSECYYSQSVDGSGSHASTCVLDAATQIRRCFGKQVQESCEASHQCVVGSYCSEATKTCIPFATQGQFCASNGECSSRFTCLDSQCSPRYSRGEGQSCMTTDHCLPEFYCGPGDLCTKASVSPSSNTVCDIESSSCPENEQCTCKGYTTPNQVATCTATKGTYAEMPTIERDAYACLDQFECGSDTNNATTITCITNNCLKEYCTYFTRRVNELFSEYPSCLVSRMVDSRDYYTLLTSCSSYKPADVNVKDSSQSGSSFIHASLSWVVFLSTFLFFFNI